ncbi:MAG: hydrogenase maturation nickel metallochaperone HypA [Nitrospira sp.]|nr:hydrogenase maturation nickel metallochaperone HypA [bacterium]MBL7048011.1 hydrogenase maturation nickel metallochaperone HypA [Nitrospira sp.]
MHEVTIAIAMAEELTRIAAENNASAVIAVRLKIGQMSGIVTDSLQFAFDAIKLEHPILYSTKVEIEEIPLIYKCRDCGASFATETLYFPECQGCGSCSLDISSGTEQHIDKVELEV